MSNKKLILLFLLISHLAFSQSNSSFDDLIAQTNQYLSTYDKLTPFGDYYSLQELGLDEQDIKGIVAIFADDEEGALTAGKDSIEAMQIIGYCQDIIIGNLEKIIYHREFKDHDITALLNDSELGIAKSEDNKLFNFTIPEKHGGTYQSMISIMHYTEVDSNLLVTDEAKEGGGESVVYEIFENDGYSNIYSISTDEGTKYILKGYVRGCTYCFENHISLVKFEDGQFVRDFYYSFDSRDPESDIEYDSESQTIEIEYVTDELTSDCYCDVEEEDKEYVDAVEELTPKRCTCVFEFNKVNFELIKDCWERIKN